MKKIIALVLAIALVLTSVVAFAEAVEAPKGTPNINSFATMKVKYHELKSEPWGAPAYWEITLSKPVDRLLINWSGKGEEPEELAVDENLKATALKGNHKYMPGTFQYYATWESSIVMEGQEEYKGIDVDTSERVYENLGSTQTSGWDGGPVVNVEEYGPERELDYDKFEDQVKEYLADYGLTEDDCIIVEPYKYINAKGEEVEVKGSIQGYFGSYKYVNKNFSTVIATPVQTAFMTVQGEWAVYYNRAGRIVGIEKFEGQF